MALNGEGMAADPVEAMLRYRQGVALGNAEEPALADVIEAALDADGRAEVERRFTEWDAERIRSSTRG